MKIQKITSGFVTYKVEGDEINVQDFVDRVVGRQRALPAL